MAIGHLRVGNRVRGVSIRPSGRPEIEDSEGSLAHPKGFEPLASAFGGFVSGHFSRFREILRDC